MKIKIIISGILIILGSLIISKKTMAADTQNLISNPGMETLDSNGSDPAYWFQDQWGDNTATFSYENNGYNSSHSLKVSMTDRTNGDAKWYFAPVTVQPDTDYVFSDYYMSNKPAKIVVMSLDAQGNPTYFDIGRKIPASASWKKATYSFHTPADSRSVSVLHLINRKNSWLQIDDASLQTLVPSPVEDNIPNNSMETVSPSDPNMPNEWSHSDWGTSTPIYEYLNEGYDGSHSVKVTMTNYESGDAKWVYTPQPLTPGKDYKFTAWYKTNTIPHVVAQYIKNDGSEDFFGLPDPEPTGTDWQQYSDVFPVPNGVKAVSLFFFLSNDGWVQTDDYHIMPYTYTGFDKGRVTLTFDDGFENNITTVLPVLDKYGMKVTYCYSTQYLEGQPSQEASVKKIASDGHETCSHTVTHADLTQLSTTDLDYELSHSKEYLASLTKQPITDFLSPYGAYNAAVNNEIAKYYQAHRTTDEGFNSKDNFNPYRLRVQNMQTTTTLAQFQSWVNKAKADHTWLILVYHVVDSNDLTQFDTYKKDFDAQMQWLANSGVSIEPMNQTLTELKAQL